MARPRYEWKVIPSPDEAAGLEKLLVDLDSQRFELVAILADRTVVARRPAPPEDIKVTFVPTEE